VDPISLKTLSLSSISDLQSLKLDSLLASLDGMHKSIASLASTSRDPRRLSQNAKSKVVNFALGDLVLIAADVRKKHKGKLVARWSGPRRFTDVISPWLLKVTDLLTRDKALSILRRSARTRLFTTLPNRSSRTLV
jgi:hypothetical protein